MTFIINEDSRNKEAVFFTQKLLKKIQHQNSSLPELSVIHCAKKLQIFVQGATESNFMYTIRTIKN